MLSQERIALAKGHKLSGVVKTKARALPLVSNFVTKAGNGSSMNDQV
jgi:hypothetical protein